MLRISQSQRFLRMALFSMLLAFLLLLLGVWSRANDAGLGCPDWPGCYGRLFAPQTAQDLNEARAYYPRQPAEEVKLFKETLHRYLSGALGLLIIRLTWLGWKLKKHLRRQQVLLPAAVLLLVFSQVVLGIMTVKLQHKPLVTMLNLSMSLSIVGMLGWVVLREHRFWKPIGELSARMQARLRPRAFIGLLMVILQILLGGWMSANYAALACPDFPACQGELWPSMDLLTGFVLWRDIGMDYEGVLLNMEAATAVHMAHRLGALAALLYVGWLSLHAVRVGRHTILWRYGLVIFMLLLAQASLGIITTLTHLPLLLIVAHSGMAALLMLSLITLNHVLRPRA